MKYKLRPSQYQDEKGIIYERKVDHRSTQKNGSMPAHEWDLFVSQFSLPRPHETLMPTDRWKLFFSQASHLLFLFYDFFGTPTFQVLV